MRVWASEGDFQSFVLADEDIARHLSRPEIERTFDLKHQLRHVEYIYRRVYES
jgi:adenylosuccinate lyase